MTIYDVPAFAVRAAGYRLVRLAGGTRPLGGPEQFDPVPTGDVVHALRDEGVPVTIALDGGRGVPPADVAEAARQLRVWTTAVGWPGDLLRVVDWVLACAPAAPSGDPAEGDGDARAGEHDPAAEDAEPAPGGGA